MEEQPGKNEDQALADLAEARGTLEAIEERWKIYRATSRRLTLELITQHGYSIQKAAKLSGHHRNTIMIWLNIHNAEVKGSRRDTAKS
jgi:hypothetical protein